MISLICKFKNKLINSIIISILLLSTFLICNGYAVQITPEMKSTGTGMANGEVGKSDYLTYSDLVSRYDILCCQHGQHLTTGYYKVDSVVRATPVEAYILSEMMNNIGSTTTYIKKLDKDGNPIEYKYDDIKNKTDFTEWNIRISEQENLKVYYFKNNKKEVYVMQDPEDGKYYEVNYGTNAGFGIYTYVQLAWWNSEANIGSKSDLTENELYKEAKAFEKYLKQVSKNKTIEYVEQEYEANGEKGTVVAPKIEYNAKFNETNPTVVWDENEQIYKIGPFSINYVESSTKIEGRDKVQFSGITDVKLYTDASKDPLTRGEDWDFIWQKGQRTETEDSEYPKSNESFYIYLKPIENATKITDFSFNFKYMNAGGEYEKLTGWYGNSLVSQQLAGGLLGVRWYKNTELHWNKEIPEVKYENGKIGITKKVTKANGEELKTDKIYKFDVSIEYPNNGPKYNETVEVKEGETKYSSIYRWKKGEEAPKYTIKEIVDNENGDGTVTIDEEKYTVYNGNDNSESLDKSIVATGILNNGVVRVNYKNVKEPKTGNLTIKKDITNAILKDKEFHFNVKVSGNFEYNGKTIINDSEVIPVTVKGESIATVGEFKWYEDAPNYSIEELESDIATVESITPKEGNLVEDKNIVVTAVNTPTEENAYLKIIKKFEIPEGNVFPQEYIDEYVKTLKFKFEVEVEGYGKTEITLDTPKKTETSYVWEYVSDKYTWIKGTDAPNYSIKEIDVPDGTKFSTASSDYASLDGDTLRGKLVSDESKKFIIDNTIINKIDSSKGSLKLIKTIVEPEGNYELENKDYNFVVTVKSSPKGPFRYKDVWYAPGTEIKLTNSGIVTDDSEEKFVVIHVDETKKAEWQSDEFEWIKDCEPECTVEEDLTKLDVKDVKPVISVTNAKLKENEVIDFTVQNFKGDNPEYEKAKLHLIKTLEDADKLTEEQIEELVFKFDISVDGYGTTTVSLDKPRKEENKYIWEYTTGYYEWKKGNNPNYTITEVDLPEGTEVISQNPLSGKLEQNEEKDFIIDNEILNKVKPSDGKIKIVKVVKDDDLKDKSFYFTVTINGTFEYNGVSYKNDTLTLDDIEVKGGNEVTIDGFKWYCGDKYAPTYNVEEKKSDIAEIESIQNSSGKLSDNNTVTVIATNDTKYVEGNLSVIKKICGNSVSTDKKFKFEISVEGYDTFYVELAQGESFEQTYKWKATQNAPTYSVKEIDIPKDFKFVSLSNGTEKTEDNSKAITGSLVKDDTVSLECINEAERQKEGILQIKKEAIIDQKIFEESEEYKNFVNEKKFTIRVELFGTFEYNGESYVKDSNNLPVYTKDFEIEAGEVITLDGIKWSGDEAPRYRISEINLPERWKKLNISNEEGTIREKTEIRSSDDIDVKVTNYYEPKFIISLLTEIGGEVWEDVPQDQTGKNTEGSVVNGLRDDNEKGLDGIEVYVYRVIYQKNGSELKETYGTRTLAKAYKDNELKEEVIFPLITKNEGKWKVEGMPAPAFTEEEKASGIKPENGYVVRYDVEFVYDGQTYEPTKFLATSNGNASEYLNAKTSERDKWAKDSKALDYNREEVNGRISQVTGNTPIDSEGNTLGKVIGVNGTEEGVNYTSYDYNYADTSRKISKVKTKDNNGIVLDLFKTKARTSVGGLTYFFDDEININNTDKKLVAYKKDPITLDENYLYKATYNYALNINLGLVQREEADISTVKDLYSAKVVANEKLTNYKFNTLADLTGDVITRQLKSQEMGINYELGLYKTDYYYRAEIYRTNGPVYDARQSFYKTLGKGIEDTELEVYLTYKISLYNESPTYDVKINSIEDYFDSSFTLVTDKEEKYVQTIDGTASAGLTEVANKSTISTGGNVNWNLEQTGIYSSNGTTYNKMNAVLDNVKLASGQKAEIFVTFKVKKDDINGVKESIITGEKSNVAEIANYSTYYKGTDKIAGKIDRDSAPQNVNMIKYNDNRWYDDDSDSAPLLHLNVSGENRTIDGTAWEDKETETIENGQKVGNGIRDDDEALIGGLTTELIEKITVKNPDGTYTDYDFLWPTNKNLDFLNGKTFEFVTGFDSITETAKSNENGMSVGGYKFIGVPAGNYVVRFLYGNDKTSLDDTNSNTDTTIALKPDGTSYSGNENVLTANYKSENIAVYNGQDYKSTTYQSGFAKISSNGYLNNAWHDLDNINLANAKVSDARDSEARRLEMMSNSEIITNVNGTMLSTANDINANHKDLFEKYYMFADTAKLNLNVENSNTLDVTGKTYKNGILKTDSLEYHIKGIDLGLEERSENSIVLDKEINSIKLTTNDSKVILDAEYDISYEKVSKSSYKNNTVIIAEVDDNNYLVAKVELNADKSIGVDNMQAINKIEDKANGTGTQNFRYINVDDTILQGTTIEIGYTITALNVGEVDRVSEKLYNITDNRDSVKVKEDMLKAAIEVAKANSTYLDNALPEIGTYLGKTYYQGANVKNNNDKIATTTVRQVIDYVDNEAVFSTINNSKLDNSWNAATINEITGNGINDNRLIDSSIVVNNNIVDKNGLNYITSQKNNIALSIDNIQDVNELTNKGFEIKLVPYSVDENNYKSSITLTTTRTVSAETDADKIALDNLAEIVKYENTVGRRDVTSIPGNTNPKFGEFEVSLKERDSSATELVTLTPPTGIEAKVSLTIQVLVITALSLIILTAGVVVIKKKVLK